MGIGKIERSGWEPTKEELRERILTEEEQVAVGSPAADKALVEIIDNLCLALWSEGGY